MTVFANTTVNKTLVMILKKWWSIAKYKFLGWCGSSVKLDGNCVLQLYSFFLLCFLLFYFQRFVFFSWLFEKHIVLVQVCMWVWSQRIFTNNSFSNQHHIYRLHAYSFMFLIKHMILIWKQQYSQTNYMHHHYKEPSFQKNQPMLINVS